MNGKQIRSGIATLALLFSLAGVAHGAENPRVITGEHWQQSSQEQKRAFLIGVFNVVGLEEAAQGRSPGASAVTVLDRGLKGLTVTDVVQRIDRYYAEDPERRSDPVIRVLYFGLAKPRAEAK